MKLSKESQYGIIGLVFLATQPPGTIWQINQVARGADLPQAFLSKIFRKLANHGILRSYKGGVERGYSLLKPAKEISLKEILEAIEGPDLFQRCVFWSDKCSDAEPCMLHEVWKTIRPMVSDRLAQLSLEDTTREQSRLDSISTERRSSRRDRTLLA
jgi:Rrf2 family protein